MIYSKRFARKQETFLQGSVFGWKRRKSESILSVSPEIRKKTEMLLG